MPPRPPGAGLQQAVAGYAPEPGTGIDCCIAKRYSYDVIRSFRHAGLEKLFRDGSKAGVNPAHAEKLRDQMATLNRATSPHGMNVPGWNLHPLRKELTGHWAVKVSGNWRLTFRFQGTDAILVDYQDYH
jgi:toxin HigB-1